MRPIERVDQFLLNRSKNTVLFLALAIALLIGIVDYFATPDLLIFYLLPIFFAAWYGGRRPGTVIAIYCAGAGYVSETMVQETIYFNLNAFWSLIARLAMFLILSRILSKLRESREQQKELTSFIVHDLRSPISSAITGLMTVEQTGELGELEHEMVSLALVSNQRALSLVNSMLDVSKLESGKMEIRHETLALNRFFDDAFAQVALWARSNEVNLVQDLHVEQATFDPGLTMRVIVNLLSNALKFSPVGSTVVTRVETAGKDGVRFSIQDQGPGIPQEYADRIFEPFHQVKGTKGGTGLGLTFCRLAVQAQGGKIWVDSHPGKGTTMVFTLPHVHPYSPEPTKPALEKA
jgi:signal transduction histidine kinase